MNNLTESFTTLAQVTTLLVIWYLVGSIFQVGFSIYKYFRALSELDKYEALVKELSQTQKLPYVDPNDRAN